MLTASVAIYNAVYNRSAIGSPSKCYCPLLLGVRCGQNLPALRRQLRQRQPRLGLVRLRGGVRMDHLILEPVSEIVGAEGFALFVIRLALAGGAAGRAFDADVEVIVVGIHRPDLGQPAPIALGFAAQRLLDGGVDEDALNARLLRGVADDR